MTKISANKKFHVKKRVTDLNLNLAGYMGNRTLFGFKSPKVQKRMNFLI